MSSYPKDSCWSCGGKNIEVHNASGCSPGKGVVYCKNCDGYPLYCDMPGKCNAPYISKIKPFNGDNVPCSRCGDNQATVQFGTMNVPDEATLIFSYIKEGDVEGVRTLLEINPSVVSATKHHRNTPLHYAVAGPCISIYKGTPDDYYKITSYLLSKNADPNAIEIGDGNTPLHEAIHAGDYRIVQSLLEHGADPNIINRNFQSPEKIADWYYRDKGTHKEILYLLKQYKTTDKEKGPFFSVDYDNLIDSMQISEKRGDRLRVNNPEHKIKIDEIHEEFKIGIVDLELYSQHLENPKIAYIEKGLMRGVYLYSIDDKKAFTYRRCETEPMFEYSADDFVYDILISYSSEDIILADKIKTYLEKEDIKCFLINVDKFLNINKNERDYLWDVRFREAMFYSRYCMPILSENYLQRSGTIRELYDGAWLTLQYRQHEFFHTMIPVIINGDTLNDTVFSKPFDKRVKQYNKDDFDWIKKHVFPISLEWGYDHFSKLLKFIVNGSIGKFDYNGLKYLLPMVDRINLIKTEKDRIVEIFIKNPILTNYLFWLIKSEDSITIKYMGVNEPNDNAMDIKKIKEPIHLIKMYMEDFTKHFNTDFYITQLQLNT